MTGKTPNDELSPLPCPHKLEDVDLFSPGAPEHWYEAYDILHKEAPVYRIPGEGFEPGTDAFVLTRHEDIASVVRDEERFPVITSAIVRQLVEAGGDPFEIPNMNMMVASMVNLRPNPPLWRSHRQELTDPWVGPGAPRHEPMVTQLANELVDKWIDKGKVEWISEFAMPLPQMVMANVLGWPMSDLHLLKYFGDGCVKAFVYGSKHNCILPDEEVVSQQAVLKEFRDYTADLIAEKRKQPQEDMISFLTEVEYSPLKRKLTDNEINGIVYAMVIGGLETTLYALSEQVQLLIERPGVWDEIKQDRSKLRAFTEEGMRLRSPTQGLSTRITSQEEEFQGVTVPKGSYLHLRWAAANIDPKEWDDPKELKLDRKAGTRHLAFSQGARVCPGATLSRVEQMCAWNVIFDRIGEFRYGENNTFMHQPGIMLGTLALNLEFDPAT
ncbi:MAG: cytochrome P450 [Proteobacteria bacterium]|nr:cytochrome P450 [Pseudomonadota bacterium]